MRSRWAVLTLLAPVLLAGCSAIPGWPASAPGAADPADRPDGDSWVVVSQGRVTPSVTPTRRATPTPSPSSGFLPRSVARPGTSPEPLCTGSQRQGQVNGLTAVPGAGSASASWYNPGGRNLVSYRLTAVPQRLVAGRQEQLTWQTITPGVRCGTMTATVTGLTRGMPYVLSLDAVTIRNGADGDVGFTVARSGLVYPS